MTSAAFSEQPVVSGVGPLLSPPRYVIYYIDTYNTALDFFYDAEGSAFPLLVDVHRVFVQTHGT